MTEQDKRLSDDARKRLEAYCPKVKMYLNSPFYLDEEKDILIAAALTRRIQERGEWRDFHAFARNAWLDSISPYQSRFYIDEQTFTQWLLDPARFAELVDGALTAGIIGKEE